MYRFTTAMILIALCVSSCDQNEWPREYPITPMPFTEVEITDHFWYTRLDTNARVTIPFALEQCETTGRLKNFRVAGGLEEGSFNSRYPFDDSDVFKIIEGASYSLHNHPDPELESYLDTLISWIAAAQEEDGYLYTFRTILDNDSTVIDWAGEERWEKTHLHSHELYNIGHLYEAAVAHHLATGKTNLLDLALKSARRVLEDFGPESLVSYPGHQEIEIGLVKLYRLTGEEKYLHLAKFFLDSRNGGMEYNQSHMPVTAQKEAVGHAVRATYMYSAMADVAALTGDSAYMDAISGIWNDVVGSKLYITGGIGAAGNIEGFAGPYELPNETAYCETCAGIANVLWNQRMFLMQGDSRYIDVLERTLYNNVLSGVSMEGDRFFYPNPLESDGQHRRSEWFACACCPSNICRFIPSVPGYIYAFDQQSIYINLFISSRTDIKQGMSDVSVNINTGFPWKGDVDIHVDPLIPEQFSLKLRVPGWAMGRPVPSDLYAFEEKHPSSIILRVNDEDFPLEIQNGYAVIERKWKKGDRVYMGLPMDIRRVVAHPRIEDNQGKMALQRGPLVYCVEGTDYPGGSLEHVILPGRDSLMADIQPNILNGLVQIGSQGRTFTAIPYYAWAHRGAGEMKVWIPQ